MMGIYYSYKTEKNEISVEDGSKQDRRWVRSDVQLEVRSEVKNWWFEVRMDGNLSWLKGLRGRGFMRLEYREDG